MFLKFVCRKTVCGYVRLGEQETLAIGAEHSLGFPSIGRC